MRVYFACASKTDVRFVQAARVKRILISVAYFKTMPEDLRERFVLDSGAFTNHSHSKTFVSLKEYMDRVREFKATAGFHGKNVCYYTFDHVGSRAKTISNHNKIRAAGLKPCYVEQLWSKQTNQAEVEKIIAQDHWIAVGGIAKARNPGLLRKGLKERPMPPQALVFQRLEELFNLTRKHRTKIHGFGSINLTTLTKFPFGAVDTASWTNGALWGKLLVLKKRPNGNLGFSRVDYRSSEARDVWKRFNRSNLSLSEASDRNAFNIRSILAAERYLTHGHSTGQFRESFLDDFIVEVSDPTQTIVDVGDWSAPNDRRSLVYESPAELVESKEPTVVNCQIIGRRRVPVSFAEGFLKVPETILTGSDAAKMWIKATRAVKDTVYRCAIENDEGELQGIHEAGRYTESDVALRWIPAGAIDPVTRKTNESEGKWMGLESADAWSMDRRWSHATEGKPRYGETPAVNDLSESSFVTVEVEELRERVDEEGDLLWSWSAPKFKTGSFAVKLSADNMDHLRKSSGFVSEVNESRWKLTINSAGLLTDLELGKVSVEYLRTLGGVLSRENPISSHVFEDDTGRKISFRAREATTMPKRRERILGAGVCQFFRNLRGIAGNLAPSEVSEVKMIDGPDVWAIVVEQVSEGKPSRLLRIGRATMGRAERIARDTAGTNPKLNVVLARLVGELDDDEIFECVGDFKAAESSLICAHE